MKYYLFLDESGDHGLSNIDPGFPIFVLSGILTSATNYESIQNECNKIKKELWGNKKVIFHSRDIRKCEKEFVILFDLNIKKKFIESINKVISSSNFVVIASAIDKNKYIKRYGRLSNDVYEIALSFIIERAVFFLDELKINKIDLNIIIEHRGKKENKKLEEHFQRLLAWGTGFVKSYRLRNYGLSIQFIEKKENIEGLQLADLVAYPIARHVLDPERANPAYEIVKEKFYCKNDCLYGLKVFP